MVVLHCINKEHERPKKYLECAPKNPFSPRNLVVGKRSKQLPLSIQPSDRPPTLLWKLEPLILSQPVPHTWSESF